MNNSKLYVVTPTGGGPLVMPTAAMSPAVRSALASAPAATSQVLAHTSSASCSTQLARGKCYRCPRWSAETPGVVVEDHTAGGGGALIDRCDVLTHRITRSGSHLRDTPRCYHDERALPQPLAAPARAATRNRLP